MSTNDTTTEKGSESVHDHAPEKCPVDRIETTIDACLALLDQAVSPQRTVLPGDVASVAGDLNGQQVGYAMCALRDGPETVEERLGRPLPIVVETANYRPNKKTRYWIRPREAPEPMTDGGGLHVGTTTACPYCDSAMLTDRSTLTPRYRCRACGETFGEEAVVVRPTRHNGGSPHADALSRADPDDIMTDGGHIRAPTQKVVVRTPEPMLDALDDFVEAGIYKNRSEAFRAAVRRELRSADPEADPLSAALQQLYDDILLAQRPEAVAQCEQVAQRLGAELSREVLDR